MIRSEGAFHFSEFYRILRFVSHIHESFIRIHILYRNKKKSSKRDQEVTKQKIHLRIEFSSSGRVESIFFFEKKIVKFLLC